MKCAVCNQDNILEASFCTNCGSALAEGVKVIALPEEQAGFWIRIGAFGLDTFIIFPIYFALDFLIHGKNLDWGYPFLLLLLHCWILTGNRGQTIGKRFFGIKVVSLKDEKVGMGRAFLREFIGKPLTFFAIFVVIALLVGAALGIGSSVTWSGDLGGKRTNWIDDWIARTKVVVIKPNDSVKTSWAYWLLEFLPLIGSVIGLLVLLKKDRRKAWAIFWGGLLLNIIIYPLIFLMIMLTFS
jgi:uncharacterized RDD family membrane protein YckC